MISGLVLACLALGGKAFGLVAQTRSWQNDQTHSALLPNGAHGQKKPHIVFVLMDDLGWHDLGFRGSNIDTPTFDRLAKEGAVLENYYVLPSCAPTRAALMTGRHAHLTGIYMPYAGNDPVGLPLSETTLPSVLQQMGYRTHMVGKWHLGFAKEEYTPTFRGFETFYGFYGWGEDYFTHRERYPGPVLDNVHHSMSDFAFDFRREEQPRCGSGCSVIEHGAKGNYSTHLFTARATNLIAQHDASEPLFLYLALQAPHAPRGCPERYDKTEDQLAQKWRGCPDDAHAPFPFPYRSSAQVCGQRDEVFCRLVADADHGMSRVLEALQSKDMLQDTVIVFSTDNGGPVNAPTRNGDAIGSSNWPLRGGKHTLYEGGVRGTGFVWSGARAPRVVRGSYNGLIHCVDWLPTLATLAGSDLKSAGVRSGRDQWSALSGSGESPHDHLLVAVQPASEKDSDYDGDESWALRKGPWKLIAGCPGSSTRPYGWSERDGASSRQPDAYPACNATTVALYDLRVDLREDRNLAAKRPRIAKELLGLLEQYRASRVPWEHALLLPRSARQQQGVPKGSPLDGVWGPWM